MNKSVVVTADPAGVATVMGPDPADGIGAVRLVAVAVDTLMKARFAVTRSLPAIGSKLVPVIVTGVPATRTAGVKLVIVGAPVGAAVTVNVSALVADPAALLRPS